MIRAENAHAAGAVEANGVGLTGVRAADEGASGALNVNTLAAVADLQRADRFVGANSVALHNGIGAAENQDTWSKVSP